MLKYTWKPNDKKLYDITIGDYCNINGTHGVYVVTSDLGNGQYQLSNCLDSTKMITKYTIPINEVTCNLNNEVFFPTSYNTDNPPYLYILTRNDLPSCNPGKMMAQVCHAQSIISECYKEAIAFDGSEHNLVNHYNQWKEEYNYGTTIVLETNLDNIQNIQKYFDVNQTNSFYSKDKCFLGIVEDPTYPFIVDNEIATLINPNVQTDSPIKLQDNKTLCFRKEITCMFIFGLKSELSLILKQFKLRA